MIDFEVKQPFPKGTVILFYGDSANIPSGWALCNGSNGTPDLRNRFVIGASAYSGVPQSAALGGATGGSNTHNHAVSIPALFGLNAGPPGIIADVWPTGAYDNTISGVITGFTDDGSTIPASTALFYIMKL